MHTFMDIEFTETNLWKMYSYSFEEEKFVVIPVHAKVLHHLFRSIYNSE